jgi:hypothetical protein
MMDITTEEFLERALNELKRRGWIKGRLKDQYGRVCSMGALDETYRDSLLCCGLHKAMNEAINTLQDIVVKEHCNEYDSIAHFNDAPETTQEDVELMFKKAIYKVRNQNAIL